jgi:hypothetical protein
MKRGGCPGLADFVAKLFCPSERVRLIQDQRQCATLIQGTIRSDSIVAYFILQLLRGDFCNMG